MNKDNTISHSGGARVDHYNATWPFASLKANKDNINLSVLGKKYIFDKDKIKNIRKYRGLFSVGLKIEHDITDMPNHIVFWTFRFKKLKKELKALGYLVAE